jgi:hypothetical protein
MAEPGRFCDEGMQTPTRAVYFQPYGHESASLRAHIAWGCTYANAAVVDNGSRLARVTEGVNNT